MPYDKVLQENIHFSDLEEKVVTLKKFDKMKSIKQNGFAHIQYFYAKNSRWDHSIGTMYWANNFYESISDEEKPLENDNLKALRLAALVHDIGHGPFSHALELLVDRNPELLNFEPWKRLIRRFGYQRPHELLTLNFVESKAFRRVIPRKVRKMIQEILGKKSPLSIILSGDLDADRLDYLTRDSHHSGLPFGLNVRPLFNELLHQNVKIKPFGTQFFLQINSEAVPAFEQLLMARYAHYHYIAYEPEILSANLFFVSALEKSLWHNIKKNDKIALAVFYIFSELTDDELLNLDFSSVEEKKRKLLKKLDTHTLKECFENLKTGNMELNSKFIPLCSLRKKLTFNFFKSKTTAIRELEEIFAQHAQQSVEMHFCLPLALTAKTLVYDKNIEEKYNPSLLYDYSPIVRALEQKMYLDCGIVINLAEPISNTKIMEILNGVDRETTDFDIKTCAILKYIKKAGESFSETQLKWALRRSRIFEFVRTLEKTLLDRGLIREKSEFLKPYYSMEVYEMLQKLEFLDAINEDFNISLGDGFIPSYVYSIGEYGKRLLESLVLTLVEKKGIDKAIRKYLTVLERKFIRG